MMRRFLCVHEKKAMQERKLIENCFSSVQTLPLKQDYPLSVEERYPKDSFLDIPGAIIAQEDPIYHQGSCCDDGVYRVAACRGWWYQCKDWGVSQMMPWIKFGVAGFSSPPASEHRRSCSYSTRARLCPLPATCVVRQPQRSSAGKPAEKSQLCQSNPLVKYLGPTVAINESEWTLNPPVVSALLQNDQTIFRLEGDIKKLKKKLRTKCSL
jgi:hypothetical protein